MIMASHKRRVRTQGMLKSEEHGMKEARGPPFPSYGLLHPLAACTLLTVL